MEKEQIKKEMDNLKEMILSKAKDGENDAMETLVDELLSKKAQFDVKPLEYNVGERVDEFKGEFFEIVKTTTGAYFKTYGGLMVFARPNVSSLYDTLCSYIDLKEDYSKLEGEKKDDFDMALNIVAYVCTLPMYAFQDIEFTVDVANMIVDYLNKRMDEALNKPLQEETPVENEEFRGAMESAEMLKKEFENGEE